MPRPFGVHFLLPPATRPMSPNRSRSVRGAPAVALIADHNDETRQLYADYLRASSFVVDEAIDGCDALALALARPPAIVVATAELHGLDGYQLSRLLRHD